MKKNILALLASAMISSVYAQSDSVKTYSVVTIEEKRLTQIPFDREHKKQKPPEFRWFKCKRCFWLNELP
jgi:hypothetical protein